MCILSYLGLQRLNSKIDAEIDFWGWEEFWKWEQMEACSAWDWKCDVERLVGLEREHGMEVNIRLVDERSWRSEVLDVVWSGRDALVLLGGFWGVLFSLGLHGGVKMMDKDFEGAFFCSSIWLNLWEIIILFVFILVWHLSYFGKTGPPIQCHSKIEYKIWDVKSDLK